MEDGVGFDQIHADVVKVRDARHVRRIVTAARMIEFSENELRSAVAQARAAGETWAAIGAALGTTKQAAFQRFGKAGADRVPDAAERPAR